MLTQSQLLLGYKKRGIGQGLFNGFGGKVEPGETSAQAALRELKVLSFFFVVRAYHD